MTPISAQVTQDGPAGTSNRCVMLREGYLEFLTPTADTPNARRMRASMKRYRGVHLACFGTPAAEEEHARLASAGFAPQPIVHLERKVEGGMKVRFSVVRAAPGKMPEGRVQYVQHLVPEAIWRARHLRHRNGVTRPCRRLRRRRDPGARRRALGALHGRRCRGAKASSSRSRPSAARC